MNASPTNPDGSPVTIIDVESQEGQTFIESLEAEFPDLPREDIASVYETARRSNGAPASDEALKVRMREIIQSRTLAHSL